MKKSSRWWDFPTSSVELVIHILGYLFYNWGVGGCEIGRGACSIEYGANERFVRYLDILSTAIRELNDYNTRGRGMVVIYGHG